MSPSICLNMIVKNESKIIIRLLDSVISIIDSYCICDTGSTDNTPSIITHYFNNKNITGKIIQEPFKNFSYNRNVALNACKDMSDYILFLDADMIIQLGTFDKSTLHLYDAYYLFQGSEDFYYKNVRIIKNNGLYFYLGVTHEYINTPDKKCELTKEQIFILDIGDGGSKSNKFERDILLLVQGIEEEPKNVRYHFYLANSYNDTGQHEKAIDMYKKRIELGGWNQEIWQSYYKIGIIYDNLKKPELAIYNWLEAFNYVPNRIENLYEIIKYYRIIGKQQVAYSFYKTAKDILMKLKQEEMDSFLFLNNDVYRYKLEYEYSILACYLGITNINSTLLCVLNNTNDQSIISTTLSNMKFYKYILIPRIIVDFTDSINFTINDITRSYNSSSASIISTEYGYLMNIRYVNFIVTEKGEYKNCDDHIITLNKSVTLSKEFKIIKEQLCESVIDTRRYIGIEDVKIFNNGTDIVFMGTGLHTNGNLGMNYGIYKSYLESVELKCEFNTCNCEKNWCFYDKNKIVYNWFPLILGELELNIAVLTKKEEKEMPKIFKKVRGSSNGFKYNNEIWFVVHIVSYESPRHYYHLLVVFDEYMNLLRYTAPFKFEGFPIEYCLGIIVEDDCVIIPYSTWDRTTKLAIYNKFYIDNIFFLK